MSAIYLTDIDLLCAECRQPIKGKINTSQWIKVEFIGPGGECLTCYQKMKANEKDREETNGHQPTTRTSH